jgi:hypothetical protein
MGRDSSGSGPGGRGAARIGAYGSRPAGARVGTYRGGQLEERAAPSRCPDPPEPS